MAETERCPCDCSEFGKFGKCGHTQAGQTPEPDALTPMEGFDLDGDEIVAERYAHTTQALRDELAAVKQMQLDGAKFSHDKIMELTATIADLKRERDEMRETMDNMEKGWQAMKRRAEAAESTLASLRGALEDIIAEADQSNGGKGAQLPIVLHIRGIAEAALVASQEKK